MAPEIKQLFHHPVSKKSIPVFVQDDVPLGLLHPLRALLQNYGAECLNYPYEAEVVIVSDARTADGQALIEEYSSDEPGAGRHGRAVLSKKWIFDCIDADAFLGPPTWGGHLIRKASSTTSGKIGTSKSPTLDIATVNVSSTESADPDISHCSSIASSTSFVSHGSSGSSTACSPEEPFALLPSLQKPRSPAASGPTTTKRPMLEGHGGAGNPFSEADDCAMINYVLDHWKEWKTLSGTKFWKQFARNTEVGKTRSGDAWARRFGKHRERLENQLREKEDGEVDELEEMFKKG